MELPCPSPPQRAPVMERQTNSIPNRHGVRHKLFPISLVCWVLLFAPLHLRPSALNAAGELGSSSACKDACKAVLGWDGDGTVLQELPPSSPRYSHICDCHLVLSCPGCSESRDPSSG